MKLKALIFSKGFTQWQLCQRIGWQESRLSRIITGRMPASPEDIKVLASALGVSPENLQKTLRKRS
jgi:transcriptional regulator with XRE-family HTH domain